MCYVYNHFHFFIIYLFVTCVCLLDYWINTITYPNDIFKVSHQIILRKEYDTYDFLINIDVLNQIGIETITPEQIKDIDVLENGYVFKVLIEDNKFYHEVTFNVTFDNYITSFVVNTIKTVGEGLDSEIESWFIECNYKYNGVDFTALDAKISELSSTE